MLRWCAVLGAVLLPCAIAMAGPPVARLPGAGQIVVDSVRSEVVLHAVVQNPVGKPCIDAFGQRVQAFIGCGKAAGSVATMKPYFVFVADVSTEDVAAALVRLGARTRISYSMMEGHRRSGLTGATKPENYLQGDPVTISVFWQQGDQWVERPYQDFCVEQVMVDGKAVEKPWTPSFVFHGSGAIYHSGTGCVACPCDCAGGIIADNRFPLYDPMPMVKFDMSKAPAAGTEVYVRIRPGCSGKPTTMPSGGTELLGAI